MFELPTSVELGGVEYSIRDKGDYRTILGIFSLLEDTELDKEERILAALIVFYEDLEDVDDVYNLPDIQEATEKMFDFFDAGRPHSEAKDSRKLIDWDNDTAMIASAVNNVAGKEIRAEEYLHWWTFISYYMSVGESTLSTVVSIRDKILSGKTMEKWERQFRQENPQYFNWNSKTAEELEMENYVANLWNNG